MENKSKHEEVYPAETAELGTCGYFNFPNMKKYCFLLAALSEFN